MDLMRKQAQRFGADCRWRDRLRGRPVPPPVPGPHDRRSQRDPSSGTLTDYTCDALIVATGASARWLGIEGPYRGNGVSTCATCDGHFYRGKEIAVVGGGDSAVEEATFLTRFASKVTADPPPRGPAGLQDHAGSDVRESRRSTTPGTRSWKPIEGEPHGAHQVLTNVKLRSTKDDSIRDLKIDGLFLAIGHVPNTAVFQGQLATTPEGYLLTRTALAWKGIEAPAGLLEPIAELRDGDERRGCFRLRRRRGHPLPPGDHRRRLGLRRGHGLREMAGIGSRHAHHG